MDNLAIYDPVSEQAVIAVVMRDPAVFGKLADILKPDDFYWRPYQWLWVAFRDLFERGLSPDILTLADELHRQGRLQEFKLPDSSFMGRAALGAIKDVQTSETGESYAVNVQDYAAKRKIDQWLTEAHTKAHNGRRAVDIMTDLERSFSTLVLHQGKTRKHTANSTVAAAVAYDASLTASKGNRDFPTGLRDLDRILGITKTELVTIAGRPGQGKSSLLQTITLNAAGMGRRVKFFSLEMGLTQVTQRFISQLCGVSAFKIMQGRLTEEDWAKYEEGRDKFTELPIIICDLPGISIGQVRTEARRDDIDAIVVDYVQLARPERRNDRRDLDIGEITMGLKALAKELDIPVIQAAQMSRAVEGRSEHKPQLSDLRESGSIENDSDSVVLIQTPESEMDNIKLIVGKHRNGPTGIAELQFNKETMRFYDPDMRDLNERYS